MKKGNQRAKRSRRPRVVGATPAPRSYSGVIEVNLPPDLLSKLTQVAAWAQVTVPMVIQVCLAMECFRNRPVPDASAGQS